MAFKDILSFGRKLFWNEVRTVKKDAPVIELIYGTCLIVGSAIYFINKAEDIAEVNVKVKETKEEIHDVDHDEEGWTQMGETRRHYIARTTAEHAGGYLKTAGPGIGLMAGGLGLVFVSHATVTSQLNAAAASLALISASYSNYRKRVIAKEGADADYEYYTGEQVKRTTEVQEDGSVKEVVSVTQHALDGKAIPHGFIFAEGYNPNWSSSPSANLFFLTTCLRTAKWKLQKRGWCTDNDIFDEFQAPRTESGQYSGAFKDWPDGTIEHTIRIRPEGIQNLINGTSPDAVVIFEYDDGTPLEDDVWKDLDKLGVEVMNALPKDVAVAQ